MELPLIFSSPGLKQENFSGHQFNRLSKLCRLIDEVYDGQVTFHGHREVAAKDCPVFDYRRVIGLSQDGVLSKPSDTSRQDGIATVPNRPVLRVASSSDAVFILQEFLNISGAKLMVDGVFGRATYEAVLKFQTENALKVDGIVGPATWQALIDSRRHIKN